jgi:hypothetical protein
MTFLGLQSIAEPRGGVKAALRAPQCGQRALTPPL